MRVDGWVLWVFVAGCTSSASDNEERPPDTAPTVDTARSDTGRVGDTAEPLPPCAAPEALGPWPQHPIAVAGASVQRGPLDLDAGLTAIRTAALAASAPTAVDLAVTSVRVTAVVPPGGSTDDELATVWVEDVGGPAVAVAVDTRGETAPGDRVNFTATEVVNHRGRPQVNALLNYDVDGVQTSIPVVDGTATLTYEAHGERLVEVWGRLTADRGPCDSRDCFDLASGSGDVLGLRAAASALRVGDCVHFIGPLQRDDTGLLLDVADPAWSRTY